MKILASIVKNEEDIIETFVRYHECIFDKIVIVDHNSADNTKIILNKLQDEFKNIEILDEKSIWHVQSKVSTQILNEYGKDADWFVFLDADEFLVLEKKLEDIVFDKNKLLMGCWYNYVPINENPTDKNVLKTITHRTKIVNLNQLKVIMHKNIFNSYKDLYYVEGQHEVHGKDVYIKRNVSKNIKICHFPIRSCSQTISKYLIGWLAKLSNPYNQNLIPDWSHWKKMFDKVKNKVEFADIQDIAAGYTYDHVSEPYQLVHDPVLCNFDLKFSDLILNRDPYRLFYDFAESLAWEFCKVKNQ